MRDVRGLRGLWDIRGLGDIVDIRGLRGLRDIRGIGIVFTVSLMLF